MAKIINNQEYLTIKEFAAAVGYTPQGIYRMINNNLNDLSKVVKTVKGVKYIPKSCISVISAEFVNENEENTLNDFLNKNNDILNDFSKSSETAPAPEKDQANTKITIEIVEMLKAELEIKNKQIEELNNRLADITETLQREQELNRRQQEISAKNLLMLESKDQKKKGIFKRLFKKNKTEEEKQ